MKNINFATSTQCNSKKPKRKIFPVLFCLTFLALMAVILWHGEIDKQQGGAEKIVNLPFFHEKQKDEDGDAFAKIQESKMFSKVKKEELLSKEEQVIEKQTNEELVNEKETDNKYYLKVFSSVLKNDAQKIVDYLEKKDLIPLMIRENGRALMYNVYVTQGEIRDLKKDGFFVFKDRVNTSVLRVGSCYYLESAKSILENLKSKGYSGKIQYKKTGVKFFSVLLGHFPDLLTVLIEQKRLSAEGFSTVIMKGPLFSEGIGKLENNNKLNVLERVNKREKVPQYFRRNDGRRSLDYQKS